MASSLGGRREPIETRVGHSCVVSHCVEAQRSGAGKRNQPRLSPESTHPPTHTHASVSSLTRGRKMKSVRIAYARIQNALSENPLRSVQSRDSCRHRRPTKPTSRGRALAQPRRVDIIAYRDGHGRSQQTDPNFNRRMSPYS